jgi:hypothetical protein
MPTVEMAAMVVPRVTAVTVDQQTVEMAVWEATAVQAVLVAQVVLQEVAAVMAAQVEMGAQLTVALVDKLMVGIAVMQMAEMEGMVV